MGNRSRQLIGRLILASALAFPSCAPQVEEIRKPPAPTVRIERKPEPQKPSPYNLEAIGLIGNILDEKKGADEKKASISELGELAAGDKLSDAMKNRAGSILAKLLQDENPAIRGTSAAALGRMGRLESWSGLVALLNDSDKNVSREAATALGQIKCRDSVGPLIDLSSDRAPAVRALAIFALGEIKSPKSIGALIMALDDRVLEVKVNAADALGKLGDAEALPALRKHARGKLKAAAKAAIESIEAGKVQEE